MCVYVHMYALSIILYFVHSYFVFLIFFRFNWVCVSVLLYLGGVYPPFMSGVFPLRRIRFQCCDVWGGKYLPLMSDVVCLRGIHFHDFYLQGVEHTCRLCLVYPPSGESIFRVNICVQKKQGRAFRGRRSVAGSSDTDAPCWETLTPAKNVNV